MQVDSEQSERTWRSLYLAALFEADSAKLPGRIAEAECALSIRDRELWYSGGDHNGEQNALTGAMRALEALRYIHQCPRVTPSGRAPGTEANSGLPFPGLPSQ
jgi:phage-related protein